MQVTERQAVQLLAEFFHRNGYVRRQNPQRFKREGSQKYKKGFEVRLVAGSKSELALIRRALRKVGFRRGKPFPKGKQIIQPLYGREQVARFLSLVDCLDEELSEALQPKKRRRRKRSSRR
jgi:hypothetical protein